MIRPTVYSFNAPYRGPKSSKEINKLFTSIVYDISVAYEELETQTTSWPGNLRFCIVSDTQPKLKFPTAGSIDGNSYSYRGVSKLSSEIDQVRMKIDQILENL